jgi:hypothetical protein
MSSLLKTLMFWQKPIPPVVILKEVVDPIHKFRCIADSILKDLHIDQIDNWRIVKENEYSDSAIFKHQFRDYKLRVISDLVADRPEMAYIRIYDLDAFSFSKNESLSIAKAIIAIKEEWNKRENNLLLNEDTKKLQSWFPECYK